MWLESYLQDYKHTLIVVSHDRGFLNEVCTDIIEFKKRQLTCTYACPGFAPDALALLPTRLLRCCRLLLITALSMTLSTISMLRLPRKL